MIPPCILPPQNRLPHSFRFVRASVFPLCFLCVSFVFLFFFFFVSCVLPVCFLCVCVCVLTFYCKMY